MVESLTQHYQWTKPEVTKSASTWGGFLNTDLDSIDALVFANQQGVVPVGSITMFAGATAPANWLICDGRSLDTTAYATLFAVLQYAHGGSGANFNLPNLVGRFPLGGSLGSSGGEANHTLATAELPAHAHGVNDPTHAHGAYQNAHAHSIATGGHAHSIVTANHTHSGVITGFQGATAGGYLAGLANGGILVSGNTSTVGNIGGNTDTAGNLGGSTDTQQPGVNVNASGTGISIANAGGGGAHNNMPPYVGLNFIIRAA